MADTTDQKLMPNTATPRMPTKMVANSMFGEIQVHSS